MVKVWGFRDIWIAGQMVCGVVMLLLQYSKLLNSILIVEMRVDVVIPGFLLVFWPPPPPRGGGVGIVFPPTMLVFLSGMVIAFFVESL
jgi:hypothetical protein